LQHKLRNAVRNVAVIAHVDHGKTTLVDAMLRQSGLLSETAEVPDRVLDNNDLERERGITILAKNTSVSYEGIRINILDTPGHHDFGGEVERMLAMADGVLLLVDAAEGPQPQTRFVLTKTLELGLPIILVINKIDRKDARAEEVLNEVFDLFIDLGAEEEQINFPVLYANGRAGTAGTELTEDAHDLKPLFEMILDRVPPPVDLSSEPFYMQVNNLGWDDYVGRLIIGRVLSGWLGTGQSIVVLGPEGSCQKARVLRIYSANGLERVETDNASAGDIVSIAGIEEVSIGDTLAESSDIDPLPRIRIDEPTLAMNFCVNNGPFAGDVGQYVTSRNLRERLLRESKINVAIRVEETASTDVFRVVGRGELQMSILVETMRREGFELMLSRPEVVTKEIDGQLHEPQEKLFIDCPSEAIGAVSELLGPRKAGLQNMTPVGDRTRLVYSIPTRGLIGFQSDFLTETRGSGIMTTNFDGWIPWQGPITQRRSGVLVADRTGSVRGYALFHLQPRGSLFVEPNMRVYEGMVVGERPKPNDIDVNPTKEKKLTNMRASGKDDNIILTRPRRLTLEQSIEFINDDELIEVTPETIRLRKKVLSANGRHRLHATRHG
jgi:GTP-binding protein